MLLLLLVLLVHGWVSGEGSVAPSRPEGGLSRSRFSLTVSSHAREDGCATAPATANSCANTAQLLTVQKSTSYNFDTAVAPSSRRKARFSSTIGTESAVLTVDVSPAPAAGTYARSAGTVHELSAQCG